MLSSSPESPPAKKRMRVTEVKKEVETKKERESSDKVRKEKEPLQVRRFFNRHVTLLNRLPRHMEKYNLIDFLKDLLSWKTIGENMHLCIFANFQAQVLASIQQDKILLVLFNMYCIYAAEGIWSSLFCAEELWPHLVLLCQGNPTQSLLFMSTNHSSIEPHSAVDVFIYV